MTAAQEAQHACSRYACAGQLHREDEVERGCQLAVLRTALWEAYKWINEHSGVAPESAIVVMGRIKDALQ